MYREIKKGLRRLTGFWCAAALILGLFFTAGAGQAYGAPGWPTLSQSVNAGAAICMDADTGAILYGKNINEKHYPASITKIMTALLVVENCSLDETVTFSESAVTGLEAGAVTAFTSAGDQLSVRDCLYALLFRSANEVANALAEHVAGSVSAFADMMNAKAKSLGCRNTHFVNPNGLNDSDHYTTAYDMALIARACMENETFLSIETVDSYTIGPTQKRPNGLTVTLGHKMKRSGTAYSDSRVVAGKTGFTSSAGNTLVTMAEEGDRRLVAVVLQDRNPQHYTDTGANSRPLVITFESTKTIREWVEDGQIAMAVDSRTDYGPALDTLIRGDMSGDTPEKAIRLTPGQVYDPIRSASRKDLLSGKSDAIIAKARMFD